MRTLIGKNKGGYIDEEKNLIYMGKETIQIPFNISIRSGDIIKIRGNEYLISDGIPYDFGSAGIRGAQIINSKDSAAIVSASGIRDGAIVLESGIGSGALSVQIGSVIGEKGIIVGIDRDKNTEAIVRKNMELFNTKALLEFHSMDINEYDFTSEQRKFDAVFLDLPDPWLCMKNVISSLKQGGRIITYLPNFDQVENTVLEMERNGLYVIETFELIKRNLMVRKDATRPDSEGIMHTAFITIAAKKTMQHINI